MRLPSDAEGMRAAWVLLALLIVGCASGPRPVLQPHTTPIPHLGITLGPERVTPYYLTPLAQLQRRFTLRVPVHSAAEARIVLDTLGDYQDLTALLLVERPDLQLVTELLAVKDHPALCAIELGNELDLFGLSLYQFAAFTDRAIEILTRGHWTADIVTGGIYTVDDASLRYASVMLDALPCAIAFGVHLYQDSGTQTLTQLQQAAGCHRIAITETGLPSRNAQEDHAQFAYLHDKTAAAVRVGAAYALIYQLVSGPCGDTSNLGNFGLLDCHDVPKPAWELLR